MEKNYKSANYSWETKHWSVLSNKRMSTIISVKKSQKSRSSFRHCSLLPRTRSLKSRPRVSVLRASGAVTFVKFHSHRWNNLNVRRSEEINLWIFSRNITTGRVVNKFSGLLKARDWDLRGYFKILDSCIARNVY